MRSLFLAGLFAFALSEAQPFHNFATVAFIRSGERTPWLRSGPETLTALGAQQMYELGQNFRGRYIADSDGPTGLGTLPIADMATARLNPNQLFIQTPDKPYLVASAQAFLQGLYPPVSINATRNGPFADSIAELTNGTAVDFPLGGYQYPNIQSLSDMDPQSVYIDGHYNCPQADLQSALYEVSEPFLSTQAAEAAFYQSLNVDWFLGDLPEGMLDYRNAYGIYDSLTFSYNHHKPTYEDLSSSENAGVYDKVRYLANQDAWYRYGNTSSDSAINDRAMAGKTLAALILGRFYNVIQNDGNATNGLAPPLTLLFGDFQPLLSFFSVTETDYNENQKGFRAIPPFASAMILELFSRNEDSTFPTSTDDLWVRFSFHNGSQPFQDSPPQAYGMFRHGPSVMDMQWKDFSSEMQAIMVNQLSDWCDACSSRSVFCWGVDNATVNLLLPASTEKQSKISPAVGGVIGAVVTLVVAGLLFGIAMFLGGIRFHRVTERRSSSLGGFKGAAKLASDVDLRLPNNAVAPAGAAVVGADLKKGHERIGSWELRAKEGSGDLASRGSFDAIEEAMGRAVQPVERI